MKMKTALVLGAGGFIGSHMVKKLRSLGYWVRGVDLKYPEFSLTHAHEFMIGDLCSKAFVESIMTSPNQNSFLDKEGAFDELYQFAADMGGAGYIFTGANDASVMYGSAQINLNVCVSAVRNGVKKVFYSSSACMYNHNCQHWENNMGLLEGVDDYPAMPDSEYGWEKLFSERLYKSFQRNYGLNVRIARFHNIYGEESCYDGGREKFPAAICRKVAMQKGDEPIVVWGDGEQTRSFLHIDECIEGVLRLMESDFSDPVNIGSDELISVNDTAKMVMDIAGKQIKIEHDLDKPQGVRGRKSDNRLIEKQLGWKPSLSLYDGLKKLYWWVEGECRKQYWKGHGSDEPLTKI